MISTVEGGSIAYLEDFFIEETYRKMGLGSKLLSHVENYCKRKGIKRIQLLCKVENIPAIKLYEGSAYKKFGRYFFYKKLSI